ncbi:MAG TPA: hypothetical protein VGV37_19970 [Aliidongia sp.]|uniref:esterase/lipase family protein n=1 Tax=Aliidongia sp. TaxID=1914230 RepID=UPI002DDCE41B|nr:hypothetical protein [Aliidongia sp.]HEV2676814.1 hypothetical protein [Aliidongia sp.]
MSAAKARLELSAVLDGDRSRRPPYRRLVREFGSLLFDRPTSPAPESLPHGGGRPILVIPGIFTGDRFTLDLRQFLERCGFQAFGWGLGVNWGPTPHLLDGVARRVDGLYRNHGPLALVGISLGGLFARDLAYDRPGQVSHVVTIASPFRLPTATTLGALIRIFAHSYSPRVQTERLLTPLPVPSTMILTRDDGIVAWDSCRAHEPDGEIFEVGGAHLTLGSSPAVRRITVERLAKA